MSTGDLKRAESDTEMFYRRKKKPKSDLIEDEDEIPVTPVNYISQDEDEEIPSMQKILESQDEHCSCGAVMDHVQGLCRICDEDLCSDCIGHWETICYSHMSKYTNCVICFITGKKTKQISQGVFSATDMVIHPRCATGRHQICIACSENPPHFICWGCDHQDRTQQSQLCHECHKQCMNCAKMFCGSLLLNDRKDCGELELLCGECYDS